MAFQRYQLSEIRTMLENRTEGVPFWVDQEANDAVNEGLLLWNALTGFWKDTVDINTTAGSFEYSLPASLVFGTRVEFTTPNTIPVVRNTLSLSSLHEMDSAHPGWQAQTTATGGTVPTTPRHWLPISIDMIAIWPADAVGGNILHVDGVSQTPRLVNDTDYIDIGAEALNVLLGYALHVLAFKEGGQRFQVTEGLLQAFLAAAMEENIQLSDSAFFRQFVGTDQQKQELPTRSAAKGMTA